MTTFATRIGLLLFVAFAAHTTPLRAQSQIVIYRCTDASGALTIQNDQPCPAGSAQQTQTIDPPPPMPSYRPREVRMPALVAAQAVETVEPAAPAQAPETEPTPPPPLFQCMTWDKNTYLTQDEAPQQRCAPMLIVGLDGRPQPGIGSACKTVTDQCQAVPEDALCKTWQRRVDEAEFRWKFARVGNDDPRKIEYDRLAAVLASSTCAQ